MRRKLGRPVQLGTPRKLSALVCSCGLLLLLVAFACGTDEQVERDAERLKNFRVWDWVIAGNSPDRVTSSRNSALGREGANLIGTGYWTLPLSTDPVEVLQEFQNEGVELTFVSCEPLNMGFGGTIEGFDTDLGFSGELRDDSLFIQIELPREVDRVPAGAYKQDLVDGPAECQAELEVNSNLGPS